MRSDFRIDDWTVRPRSDCIERGEETVHVHPKPMAVLECLAAACGEVVTREELFEEVWPGVIVTDDALTQCVVELRKALGDCAKDPKFIKTVPKVGFALICPVEPVIDTPREKWPVWAMAVTVLVVLTLVLAWWFSPLETAKPGRSPFIAVLHFKDMSENHDQEWFAGGLTVELHDHLSRLSDLRVASLSSSLHFKGRNETPGVIARKLGVNYLLEGSVRREGEWLRVSTCLIDPSGGACLWTGSFEQELREIFDVQENISVLITEAIQQQLGLEAGATEFESVTASREAHDALMRGRQLLGWRTNETLYGAVREFDRAVEIDPEYALAHAELAMAIFLLRFNGGNISREEAQARGRLHAETAMSLDPGLAEAHAALARFRDTHEETLESYKEAIRLNPNYAIVYTWMASPLTWLGRYSEAFEAREKGLELDPLSIPAISRYVNELLERMRLDEARQELEKLAYLKPDSYAIMRGKLASTDGHWAEWALGALDGLMISPGSKRHLNILTARLAAIGLEQEALAIQSPLKRRVFVLMMLGRHQQAYEAAEEWLADSPDSQSRRSLLARTLISVGDEARARTLLEEAWQHNDRRVTRLAAFTPSDAAALLTLRRKANDQDGVSELLTAMAENVERMRDAGIIGYGNFVSTDFVEGMTTFLAGDRGRGLALIARAVEAGYFIHPAKFYPPDIYEEPRFAQIQAKQDAVQARERARFLSVVCDDNPYQEVWQPVQSTCGGYEKTDRTSSQSD